MIELQKNANLAVIERPQEIATRLSFLETKNNELMDALTQLDRSRLEQLANATSKAIRKVSPAIPARRPSSSTGSIIPDFVDFGD